MKKKYFLLICVLFISITFYSNEVNSHASLEFEKPNIIHKPISNLVASQPIKIYSDTDFVTQGYPGNGTIEDPYRIENLLIENVNDYGIYISGVNKFFIIQNCEIRNSSYDGIFMSKVDEYNGNVTNNVITGCTLEGMNLQLSEGITIEKNTFENNLQGIKIKYSPNSTVKDNIFRRNRFAGVTVEYESQDSLFENNTFDENRFYGLNYFRVNGSSIYNNSFYNDALRIDVNTLSEYLNYNVENNLVNSKKLGYFKNTKDLTLNTPEFGQVFLLNCSNISINNQVVEGIFKGFYVRDSFNCSFVNNTVSSSWEHGFDISNSDKIRFIGNVLRNNSYGLNLDNSHNLTIADNRFYSDGLVVQSVEFEDLVNYDIRNNTVNDLKLAYHFNETGINLNVPDNGQIIAINCSNFKVENQLINDTHFGIIVAASHDFSISSSTILNTEIGMMIFSSENISAYNIEANYNEIGIRIFQSENVTVDEAECNFNEGTALESLQSNSITITNGIFQDNNFGVVFVNNYDVNVYHNIMTRNTIVNLYGYEVDFINIVNVSLSYGDWGLYLILSNYGYVNDSIMDQNNVDGINLLDVDYFRFYSNNVSNSFYGIKVRQSGNNIFASNRLIHNHEYGISLDPYCADSLIYNNYFINNKYDDITAIMSQGNDDGINNTWYDFDSRTGNWWSNIESYTYRIAGYAGSVDIFPLNPKEYTTPTHTPSETDFPMFLLPLLVIVIVGRHYLIKRKK